MPAELPEPVKAAETPESRSSDGAEKVFRPTTPKQIRSLPQDFADSAPAGHPARLVDDLVENVLDLSLICGCPLSSRPSATRYAVLALSAPGHGGTSPSASSRPRRTARCARRVRRPLLPTAGWRRYFSGNRSHRRSTPARTERAAGSKIALSAGALLAARLASPRHSPLGLIARSTRLFASAV